ncbi:diguanylate cyclase [Pseudovibrio exalbescens]|uniref:diguanylate cyclase domain-containing protein n=1 Tax=Pseudovibrio exalbescens TaxID=197461 RepID=UPI0023666AE1|nr:diguanylate cyclase [Pseudovibrio exalbescens]MDD7910284.1 diguanylate cyclase [Pseudovibrio exalbescens]
MTRVAERSRSVYSVAQQLPWLHDWEFMATALQTLELFYEKPVRFICFSTWRILAPDQSMITARAPLVWLRDTLDTRQGAVKLSRASLPNDRIEAAAAISFDDEIIGALVMLPAEDGLALDDKPLAYLGRLAEAISANLSGLGSTNQIEPRKPQPSFTLGTPRKGVMPASLGSAKTTAPCDRDRQQFPFEDHPCPTLLVWTDELQISQINRAARRLFKEEGISARGETLAQIYEIESGDQLSDKFDELTSHCTCQLGATLKVRGPSTAEHELRVSRTRNGSEDAWLISIMDVTSQLQQQAEVRQLAVTDKLTGLHNRLAFDKRVERAFTRAAEQSHEIGLLMVDMDHLKLVNDTMGHEFGDALLKEVANRLKRLEDNGHLVARLGGDEFAVLLEPITCAELQQTIKDLPELIKAPVKLGDQLIHPSVSIGAACYPRHADNAKDLIRFADVALYSAKNKGRNCTKLFSEGMQQRLDRSATIAERARGAVETRRIELAYSPIIDLQTNEIRHLAAQPCLPKLGGRQSREGGLYDSLSDYGLIADLHALALEQTITDIKRLDSDQFPFENVTVTTPLQALFRSSFLSTLVELTDHAGIARERITIEINESKITPRNHMGVVQRLQDVSQMGFGICLSHFGSGIASLSYLSKLNLRFLKMDAQVIEQLSSQRNGRLLLASGFGVARNLNLSIVATNLRSDVQEWTFDQLGGMLGQRGGSAHAVSLGHLLNLCPQWNINGAAAPSIAQGTGTH